MTEMPGRQTPSQKAKGQPSPIIYEIKVQGYLDPLWAPSFEGMTLSNVENGESGLACTLISGPVLDQPALYELLIKIRDLNLMLISVRRISPGQPSGEEQRREPDLSD